MTLTHKILKNKNYFNLSTGILLIFITLGVHHHAQNFYWDANGSTAGVGAAGGTWDTTTANWQSSNSDTGTPTLWNNTGSSIAHIAAGTSATGAQTITLSGTINLAGLNLNQDSGLVTTLNSGILNFGSTQGTVDATQTGGTTIQSEIQGTAGLLFSGSRVTLSGNNLNLSGSSQNNSAADVLVSHANALGTGNFIMNNTSTGEQELLINNGVTLNTNITVNTTSNGGTHILGDAGAVSTNSISVYSGNINNQETTLGEFQLRALTSNTLRVTGVISGTGSVEMANAGTVELANANTYSGGSYLQFGTTFVTHNQGLGTNTVFMSETGSGSIIVPTTGTVRLQLGNNVNISNNLDIGEANNTKQILVSGSANATLSGNIQIDETDLTQFQLQVNAGSTLTLNTSSVMSGVGGFIRSTGAGQLIIDSANTYSGGTTLNIGNTVLSNTSGSALGSGNVNLGGTSTLTLDHNGSLILANNSSFIQNSANSAITIGSSNTASSFTIDTTDSGALSAGNPIMEVDWTAGAVNLQLFARTAGLNPISNNDHLIFTGTGQIRATNTLNITTSGVNSNTFLDGDSWDLFTFSSLLPYQFQFSSFNLPTLTSGLFWNTSTLATDGRISVTLVPEPSRILFCAVACTSLLLRRRRSRSIF